MLFRLSKATLSPFFRPSRISVLAMALTKALKSVQFTPALAADQRGPIPLEPRMQRDALHEIHWRDFTQHLASSCETGAEAMIELHEPREINPEELSDL
jgi:hypothetical protein